jgi:uncharacterized protein YbjT (DUF2867 family)
MRILVIGGTGKVGSAAVLALGASPASLRVLSRLPESAAVPAGVEVVKGDLEDRDSLDHAFAGVDRAGFIPPLHPEEGRVLRNGIEAAARAGVERLVLLTVHHLDELPDAVHLTGKRAAERQVERLGLPTVFLRPNNFFQNDLAVEMPIREYGVYPVPLGPVGCNSIDTRDVGQALANLLTGEDRVGQRVPLVGAQTITGPGAAETWSRALGREVRYGSADLDAWAAQMRVHLPAWMVDGLLTMYRHVAAHGLLASDQEIAETARVLGRPARAYAEFVAERATP